MHATPPARRNWLENPTAWEYAAEYPRVLRFDGLSVIVYPADHVPAHVHVFGGGSEALFKLNCPAGPVELRENYGFSRRGIAKIRKTLDAAVAMLCAAWRPIHGQA